MLAALFDLIRDVATFAAATGIAWWCWDQFRTRPHLRNEAARAVLVAERQAADLKLWTEKLDARVAGLVEELCAARLKGEARAAAKLRIHALLQSTTDPYLTFDEIAAALAQEGHKGAAEDEGRDGVSPAADSASLEELRHALIELVGDGIVAQLDRDRYLIASDYETGAGDADSDHEGVLA